MHFFPCLDVEQQRKENHRSRRSCNYRAFSFAGQVAFEWSDQSIRVLSPVLWNRLIALRTEVSSTPKTLTTYP